MAVKGSTGKDSVDPTVEPVEDDRDDVDHGPSTRSYSTPRRRRRRLPILLIAVVVIVVVAVVAIWLGSSKTTYQTFTDRSAGFKLSYRSSWSESPSGDTRVPLVLSFGADGLDTFLVTVTPMQASVDTSNVADIKAFTDAVISGTKVDVEKQLAFTVDGIPGYYYFYSLPKEPSTGIVLVHSHFFVFPPHEMVQLMFQTETQDTNRFTPDFNKVLASLKIIPAS
jgi:hypothetical protein